MVYNLKYISDNYFSNDKINLIIKLGDYYPPIAFTILSANEIWLK